MDLMADFNLEGMFFCVVRIQWLMILVITRNPYRASYLARACLRRVHSCSRLSSLIARDLIIMISILSVALQM